MGRYPILSFKARLLLVYVVLLLASTAVRLWPVAEEEASGAGPGFQRSWGEAVSEGSAIALLSDSGGDVSRFEAVGAELARATGGRVVALDSSLSWSVAGEGETSRSVAIAAALERAFDARPVHLVGLGYGGALALEIARAQPGRIASVTLVSTAVSPRYNLLGDASLNTALRGFRYAWTWTLQWFSPHFGLLDHGAWGLPAAEAEFAVDREAVESAFESLRVPLLLVRAGSDWNVPEESFAAFRRVQPGASAKTYQGPRSALLAGHAETFAADYLSFLEEVRSRLAAPNGGERFDEMPGVRIDGWVAGTLLAVATFASEDLACIGGGLLASKGSVGALAAIIGCLTGIFVGDLFIYLIGKSLGASALQLRIFRGLASPETLERGARWFERRGVMLVVLTRFLPGSRVPTYFAAGVVGVGFWKFAIALLIASAVWTPILVGLAYMLGPQFLRVFEGFGAFGWLGIAALVVTFVVLTRVMGSCMTWRGRRLLYSRWLRLIRWEFWPAWALYPPVVLYIAWLMLRFRSATLPSVTNPCMPASGLVYESKSQILGHLRAHGAPVGRFTVIPFDTPLAEKLEMLSSFMKELGLGFPIVLKPDVGQRGQGVTIARSMEQARAFLAIQSEDTIAQEYIGGVEYGVFYQRAASEETGRVTSITDKRMVGVVGDGRSTLEELILRDARAVCMARFFLREFDARLETVVPDGERFWLTSVGTHCRGALFLDGQALLTPELQAEVDRFSRVVEGFHFGRYDLRAPSVEDFVAGRNLRIIELNGLTSEPTNMYDPGHSIFFAWRTLMRQWRRVFEIAKENRLAGHEPDSARKLIGLAVAYLRGATSRDLS